MKAPPFLIAGFSEPTKVPEETWIEWYKKERMPRLVQEGFATRVVLYRELAFPGFKQEDPSIEKHASSFLVLVQTDNPDGHDSPVIQNLPQTSSIFRRVGQEDRIQAVSEAEVRDYELIQDVSAPEIPSAIANSMVTIEMTPKDADDFNRWYEEEHIPMLSQAAGWRRCMRYRWQHKATFEGSRQPCPNLTIHELESLSTLSTPEADAANTTDWTGRQIRGSSETIARAWELVHTISVSKDAGATEL